MTRSEAGRVLADARESIQLAEAAIARQADSEAMGCVVAASASLELVATKLMNNGLAR